MDLKTTEVEQKVCADLVEEGFGILKIAAQVRARMERVPVAVWQLY